MNRNYLIAGLLMGALSTTIMANESSFIYGFRYGSGDINYGTISGVDVGDEGIKTYGGNFTYLQEVTNGLELGAGVGYDLNELEDTGSLDYESLSTYLAGRYNFNEYRGFIPYFALKGGYKFGKESVGATVDGNRFFIDLDTKFFASAGIGVEYNNFGIELGYEYTDVDLAIDVDLANSTSRSLNESIDQDMIYLSLTYRIRN